MLSVETQSRLAKVLVEIGRGEGRLEMERQFLAKQADYSPYACFLRIDRAHKGWVNSVDILNFLRDNGIFATQSECYYLVKFFDVDLDGRLDYLQFLHIMFPCTNPDLRAVASQKPDYGVDKFQPLPYALEKHLALLIEKEIQHHRRIEPLRQDLAIRSDYSVIDCFRQIDILNSGEIKMDNLQRFLRRNSYFPSEDELGDIVRRIDKDADNVISNDELRQAIEPIEPSSRLAASQSRIAQASPARLTSSSLLNSGGSPLRNRSPPAMRKTSSPIRESVNLSSSYLAPPAPVAPSYSTPLKSSAYKPSASRFGDTNASTAAAFDTPAKNVAPLAASRTYEYSPERTSGLHSFKHSKLDSPMKPLEEQKFVQMVSDQIAIESDLEKSKKDLALCSDFNLIDAFRLFDPLSKGYITTVDLQDGLKEIGLYPSYEEVSLFFRRYDSDNDGRLRYSNFCEAFTPKQLEFQQLLQNRQAYHSAHLHHKSEYFSSQTRIEFRRCWKAHLDLQNEAELLRQRMSRRPSFNIHEAFKTTDRIDQGYITVDQLRSLLNDHKYYPSEKELVNLVNRYDRNKDGRISYSEFVEEVAPKSPRKI